MMSNSKTEHKKEEKCWQERLLQKTLLLWNQKKVALQPTITTNNILQDLKELAKNIKIKMAISFMLYINKYMVWE